jgi:HlyD family secretion protein
MTATVEFVINRAEGVLKVPNTALRFQPTADMVARAEAASATGGVRPTTGSSQGTVPGAAAGPSSDRARSAASGMLWFVEEDGEVQAVRVRTGLTDGQATVVEGESVEEGMQVIAAVVGGAAGGGEAAPNPFQSQQRQAGPPSRF